MRRLALSFVFSLSFVAVAAAGASSTATLATPPIVGNMAAGEHVYCLVSNVGAEPAPFRLVFANPLGTDVLLALDPDIALGPGSFNAYEGSKWAGYCRITASRAVLRDLRLAACVAPANGQPSNGGAACRTTVEGR